MNKKISIIIPCFNGYKYSQKCLESLSQQTYKDFEVILIDDCSTDNSYNQLNKLLKSFSSKFHSLLLRNPQNMGPGYSREQGILNSSGEYICFCDIDDYYEKDFLEIMVNNLERDNLDTVFCDYNYVFSNGEKKEIKWYKSINDKKNKKQLIAFAQNSLCILMTRKDIIKNIKFPYLYHGEDAAIIPLIISNSNKIGICQKALYNYCMRNDSASNHFDRKSFDSSVIVFDFINNHIGDEYYEEKEFLGTKGILYSGCLNAIKCHVNHVDIKRTVETFLNDYPNYNKNKYYDDLGKLKRIFIFLIVHKFFNLASIYAFLHTKYINH